MRFISILRPVCFLVAYLLLLFVGGCEPVEQSIDGIYIKTLNLFDARRPGYGIDTGFHETALDYPMSYALFASAEARRYQVQRDAEALRNALSAAEWLVLNADLDEDQEIGWGLPFAWDAFGDGSINVAHTEYAITTALAIQGLLDVYDILGEPTKRDELLRVATSAAETFGEGRFDSIDDSIVFWYSTRSEDSYHVLNVSAMLVGQFQRLSGYMSGEKAKAFSGLADRGVLYLLRRAQEDDKGNVYWLYGGDKWRKSSANRPNDLVHESYTIQGLVDYSRYGGRFSDLIDKNALLKTLSRFIDNGRIYEYPRMWAAATSPKQLEERARLWGVGYAMYVTATMEQLFDSQASLSVEFYRLGIQEYFDGHVWWYKPDKQDSSFYPRQVAHLILGLAFAAFKSE